MGRFAYSLIIALLLILGFASNASAGWVNGYLRNDGTWVNGYYRTEPDAYKWNNYSFDDDWSDAYNDNTWYRNYGYDPEPFDDDFVSDYSMDYYYDNSYDYDYYGSYDSYDTYDYYDSGWSWDWWNW